MLSCPAVITLYQTEYHTDVAAGDNRVLMEAYPLVLVYSVSSIYSVYSLLRGEVL